MKRRLFFAATVLGIAPFGRADIITQWDFNSGNDASTSTGTTTPWIGSGTASLLGVTATFSSGDASGGSTDPNVGDDSAWNTTAYAPQGTESGNRGVQFMVSTVGYNNVVVSYDQRHSNTSSRFTQLDYTLDGGSTWNMFTTHDAASGGDIWYNGQTYDLSSITGASNNAGFGFRVVSIFEPSTSAYKATTSTSTYSGSGTLRYDMVTVNGTAVVPEPASLAAITLGVGALIRRRRAYRA